jgi:hypothetical protein
MAVRLQFEGIRCFSEPQDAVIRPITLLVGENSSGKTTFLALCRIAHAIANGYVRNPPFNADPFWLGAYDQIAAFHGGRSGRAKSLSLTIGVDDGERRCSLSAEYLSVDAQPSPCRWRFQAGDLAIQAISRGDRGSMVLEKPEGKTEVPYAGMLDFDTVVQFPERPGLVEEAAEAALGLKGDAGFNRAEWRSLSQAVNPIRKEFRGFPYAFAPIRTSPQRTYDPISAEPKPEGSHVPMLLALLSRSSQQAQWNTLQSALKEFGSKSGLFDEIEIVNKGKKESDPFQVGVKSSGRTFNLIDVGYGVSQALPILVDTLQRASAPETFLLQQPEVHLHPKAQAELGTFFAKQAKEKRRFVIETHSDYLVDRIRMEVRRKLLKPEDVSLLYFERGRSGAKIHNLELDANGSITNPPPGFRQFFLSEERELLGI